MVYQINKPHLYILLAAMAIAAIPAVFFFTHFRELLPYLPSCPSRLIHIYCPGCGTTRALYCLFHGNIYGFFRNNLILFPSLLLVLTLWLFPEFGMRHHRLLKVYGITVVIYFILRNLPWYPFTLLLPVGI